MNSKVVTLVARCGFALALGCGVASIYLSVKAKPSERLAIVKQLNLMAWEMSDTKAQNAWLDIASSVVRKHGPFTNEDGSVLILLSPK